MEVNLACISSLLWVKICMIKPKKLLSSLAFVIITSKVKSSFLLHNIGKFKLNLMLRLKGNGDGECGEKLFLPSRQSFRQIP